MNPANLHCTWVCTVLCLKTFSYTPISYNTEHATTQPHSQWAVIEWWKSWLIIASMKLFPMLSPVHYNNKSIHRVHFILWFINIWTHLLVCQGEPVEIIKVFRCLKFLFQTAFVRAAQRPRKEKCVRLWCRWQVLKLSTATHVQTARTRLQRLSRRMLVTGLKSGQWWHKVKILSLKWKLGLNP